MTDPGSWALRYAASGLPVLPLHGVHNGQCSCRRQDCHSPGKHPRCASGKDDATTDPEQVTTWWRRWPGANVGIRPPVGVIVLDVDPRNQGATTLLELTRQRGQLPQTLTARTGSGGLHVWLSYAGPARGQLCRGVDVKGNNGFLVCPPSMHASGQRYEWLTGLPTARAPRWVRRILDPPQLPAVHVPAVHVPAVHVPAVRAGGQVEPLVRYVAEATEGTRNAALYWAACRAHETGLDPAPLVVAAVAAGLTERDAAKTAASAAKAPPRKVGTR